jgi:ketosteroid isomerase-like protein
MAFNINEFKSQLVGGGARPSLFQVQILNPVNPAADFKVPFLVRAAGIPASNLGSYTVPYFGRQVKYAGDRTFEDWTITVINDEDFAIRNAMEAWSNAVNTHDGNLRALPQEYKSNAIITQFSKDGSALRSYVFEGMFPITISGIAMDWNTVDAIEEFDVTFQYDFWRVEGVTGIPTT